MSETLPPKETVETEESNTETKVSHPAAKVPLEPLNDGKEVDKPFEIEEPTRGHVALFEIEEPTRGHVALFDTDDTNYGVRVIETITIDYKPTIVICEVSEDVKPGLYYISNINDVMIKQKIWIASGFIKYRGDNRIELVVMNLIDAWFPIPKDFKIAYMIPFNG